mmetsp:Transcript_40567/g.95252  ORF Transcript_40567/g.95252 Transcript_40567/m.95252 type:complete len:239 (-) Transcript_40567:100-816(-)
MSSVLCQYERKIGAMSRPSSYNEKHWKDTYLDGQVVVIVPSREVHEISRREGSAIAVHDHLQGDRLGPRPVLPLELSFPPLGDFARQRGAAPQLGQILELVRHREGQGVPRHRQLPELAQGRSRRVLIFAHGVDVLLAHGRLQIGQGRPGGVQQGGLALPVGGEGFFSVEGGHGTEQVGGVQERLGAVHLFEAGVPDRTATAEPHLFQSESDQFDGLLGGPPDVPQRLRIRRLRQARR